MNEWDRPYCRRRRRRRTLGRQRAPAERRGRRPASRPPAASPPAATSSTDPPRSNQRAIPLHGGVCASWRQIIWTGAALRVQSIPPRSTQLQCAREIRYILMNWRRCCCCCWSQAGSWRYWLQHLTAAAALTLALLPPTPACLLWLAGSSCCHTSRSKQFLTRDAMQARYMLSSCVPPSALLSVTSQCCIETTGRIALVLARRLPSAHRRRHHGAQRGTCPPLLICRGHGGAQITDMKRLIHL